MWPASAKNVLVDISVLLIKFEKAIDYDEIERNGNNSCDENNQI